jgi:hypothetical protein
MPLKRGYSRETISANVSELSHKRSRAQAVAIALSEARESAKKAGKPWKGPPRKRYQMRDA